MQRERVFERPVPPPKAERVLIDTLVDVSGSMGDPDDPEATLWTAIHTAMLIERACEIVQLPILDETALDVIIERDPTAR